MKKIIGFVLFIIIFTCLSVSVKLQAQETNKKPGLDNYISNMFSSLQIDSMPGASVLVSQNGEVIFQKGFGYANIEKKIPVTLIPSSKLVQFQNNLQLLQFSNSRKKAGLRQKINCQSTYPIFRAAMK